MNSNMTALIKLNSNIYRCTQVYMDKKLEKFEITMGTYPYLMVLNRRPGISQNEISKELNVDKAMSARTIKKLIELGYVTKEENKEDIRAYKLYITDKAKSIIPEIVKSTSEWINILVEGSTEQEIETSLKFLASVLENGKKYRAMHFERSDEE